MAGLGAQLQALGAQVRVCAPPDQEFAELLERAGVPLAPAFSSVREWVGEALKRQAAEPPERKGETIATHAARIVASQYAAICAAAQDCDAIVAAGLFPSTAAARSVAERMGIGYVYAAYCPLFLPSSHQRPYEYPGHPLPADVSDNKQLWEFDIQAKNALFGAGINHLRASVGLPPVDNVRDHVLTERPWLASDPTLCPWPPTSLREVVQTGAWILPDERPLPDALLAFLDAGAPPVYVGFGSMPMQGLKESARVVIEAIRAQGHRVLLSQGWAELALSDDRADCFVVGEVNQQALFRRVAVVVHHGGAGTTTTAARAGTPQVVVPQIADQPYWAGRVADLGIGVAHAGPSPSMESFSAAVDTVLSRGVRARASAVAGMIRIDGAEVAAKLLVDAFGQGQRRG
ncbi:glycosyltransferase [Lysobacter gummosus]|uniref:Glycosyltransferase n=1 Tax=Lysobacter gummosus TaxID=262324 RepID=A0ABY3XIM1_9GAMM|nr:glycosyltransferase [Lysobacter gummosus]ALN91029.1 glycosyltransferase GtfB [Lysobacter gummosus]UNP31463.1 glycosyltransferase [Lysobacter gummosus]